LAPSLHWTDRLAFQFGIMASVDIAQTVVNATAPHTVPAALNPGIALMLWEAAEEYRDKTAIIERGSLTDYGSLCARAGAFARALADAGIRPQDRVAIFLERGADAAAALFGASAVGGIAVVVNETLRPRQIEHILSHASAAALVTTTDMLKRLPRELATSTTILDAADIPAAEHYDPVSRVSSDIAQIIYTSGSTGLPKGVTITHGNLWAGMRAVTTYLDITSADRIASLLPFSFDYGCNQLFCAIGTGATLVVERSPVPQQLVATLREQEITVLPAVPPLWLQLVQVPEFRATALRSLRVMTNTGGRLPAETVRALRTAHPHASLVLMYGLTEAFRATYLPPDEVDRRPDSIGQAIPGSEIMVLREDLTPCDANEVGELVQRGPTVAAGYWADPETTARVFRPNPLRAPGTPDAERVVFSGDLVRRDSDGFLYFVGRRDRMIKTMGFRVSPDEVAEVLYASAEITEGLVDSEPDDERGERIVAYVVLRDGGSLERLELFCRRELPRHMQPSRLEVRPSLPRTSSGKHDVKRAREMHEHG
jgi:amino acid adenylation domain-containing protein